MTANADSAATMATQSSETLTALEKMEEPTRAPSIQNNGSGEKLENTQKQQQPPLDRAQTHQDEILVTWDENDPMHPFNMSRARRWLITVIVSLGSICVYVYPVSMSLRTRMLI